MYYYYFFNQLIKLIIFIERGIVGGELGIWIEVVVDGDDIEMTISEATGLQMR